MIFNFKTNCLTQNRTNLCATRYSLREALETITINEHRISVFFGIIYILLLKEFTNFPEKN